MDQEIKMYTNHMNLLQDALHLYSDWVMRCRLFFKEYRPKMSQIVKDINTLADAISRLDMNPTCK